MIHEVIASLFGLNTILAATFGCLFGIALGCIPGLNGGIGISLLLPFTFSMPQAPALLMLGGCFMGSSYGGSISAILLNVPGTPDAYCTSLEGYPMAKNQKGKEALYLAILASVIGGVIGVSALIGFAPALARFALKFGPPEYFLVGMVGLTVVGGLAGKNILKGLASICVGLLLGLIGFDTLSGGSRLTYGFDEMVMGIELMPVVLGIFAISEMMIQIEKIRKNKSSKAISAEDEIKDLGTATIRSTLSIVGKNKLLLLKSSLIGTFIGILPGPGSAISSFIAYGEAKRKPGSIPFGKGNPRGVLAAESANNSAVGGSFVPMMSLGIPGSPTAAVMLGAMIINGLQPGPRLFVENPVFAYTFTWGMLITIVIMALAGIFLVPLFVKILKIDMKHIVVTVILCSLLGSYSIRNSMFDVFVTCVIGVFGFFFDKYKIPKAPIVLGIILSSLIERNFRLSLQIASAHEQNFLQYIIGRPLCIGILVVGLFLVLLNIRTSILAKKI
jgi:putative tricarboxylic transport membrane protein